jgi:hypothetical protein
MSKRALFVFQFLIPSLEMQYILSLITDVVDYISLL